MMVRRPNSVRRLLAVCVALLALTLLTPSTAEAHSELLQASPRVGSTVGGEFHSVAMLFGALDETGAFEAALFDPAGTSIGRPPVSEDGQIVIPIDPLEMPGTYTVSYTTTGVDRDVSSETFTFRFDPTEPPPPAIDLELATTSTFEWLDYLVLLALAGAGGFLTHRVRHAWRLGRQPAEVVR